MKICSVILAIVLLTGCGVVEKDYILKEVDLNKLNLSCNKNSGFKEAQRAILVNKTEWQVTCKDGARFIFDGI